MKKLVVVVVVMLSFIGFAQAQHTNFGVKAGYNSASVDIDPGDDYDAQSGFHVGALAHIHCGKYFAVQPELVFSTQGGEDLNGDLDLKYINVPVLAQYMVSNGFRLQTGPQIGFLVSAQREVNNVDTDVSDLYNTVDVSWAFGAGYVFSSGLGIDARFNLGLTDIREDNAFKAKNRVFQVGLFYQFRNGSNVKK